MHSSLLVPLAAAVACLQVGMTLRWEGVVEHQGAVAVGWFGALWLLLERRRAQGVRLHLAEAIVGASLVGFACAVTVVTWEGYRAAHRLLPLLAGLGLAVLASGVRGLPQHGRLLAVLGAALLSPLPSVVRERTAFLEPTAAAAEVLVQLAGTPVAREGVLLFVDGGTVEVTPLCSGLKLAGQLGVLALLLLCLFRTTARQKVGVVLAAVFVGFLVNTGRVAFLTLVAAHAQDDFVFWDGDGLGSNVFPLVGTLLAASAWWLLLGGVRGLRAASGGPQPPTVARYTTPSPSSP